MSFAEWPSTVPAPERDTLRRVPLSTEARRRCQSGRTEVRRFGSGAPDMIHSEIRIASGDYADLIEFYEDDCAMGETWFTADWIEDLGYTSSHAGRFVGYPQIGHRQGMKVAAVAMAIQHQDYT